MKDRRHVAVEGVVQGVGFRPFVYGLARRLGLAGSVWNDAAGVRIDVEGERTSLDAFLRALVTEAPPLARVDRVTAEPRPPGDRTQFSIDDSRPHDDRTALVSADVATCPDCLEELADRRDRRYRYPFLNCTNCGPRFTIVTDVPYDRERTAMAAFAMCPACRAEYDDPADRRFHAQPIACPACGPRMRVTDTQGHELGVADPIAFVAARLREGAIAAVKGLGGYHLACEAGNEVVVGTLRRRKGRDAKPLAVMVPDVVTARSLCEVSAVEARLLASPARPIVLLRKRDGGPVARAIAPGHSELGIMLPYTPLHHLLLVETARPLVMTSGNRTEEPTAHEDPDALARLSPIADVILTHDRPIHVRCDDSVSRVVAGRSMVLRRARGYAPLPLKLRWPSPVPLLACGAQLKNTFCLVKGDDAFLSPHIGDLDEYRTYRAFADGIEHFKRLFGITPEAVAHDLHPDYVATRYARELPLRRVGVQHHHAHIASCMAENGLTGRVIGVAWDGTGYGLDGHVWGGEFLGADYTDFDRLAYLEEVPLPGGEQAIRQPWRMAAAYLHHVYRDAMEGLDLPLVHRLDRPVWRVLRRMIVRGVNTPPTSSAGRLVDAVAALLGVRDEARYEAQAAMELEALAEGRADRTYPFEIAESREPAVIATGGIIEGVVDDLRRREPVPQIAARFHATLAVLIAAVCGRIRSLTGLQRVVLSGGVFQNVRLLDETVEQLGNAGFEVFTHSRVPPNDGGIAFGQAAVAAARLTEAR